MGLSLANKCQLLFGFAVVVILAAALAVPWISTRGLIGEFQIEEARRIADAWLADRIELGPSGRPSPIGERDDPGGEDTVADEEDAEVVPALPRLRLTFLRIEEIGPEGDNPFAVTALERFRADSARSEHTTIERVNDQKIYRYARALRESQMRSLRDAAVLEFNAKTFEPLVADPLRAVLIVDRTTEFAAGQLLRIQIYIIAAGVTGTLLAILVFYFILKRLILSPVRKLRRTVDNVESGDLRIRSDIQTGDEFEELAGAFNTMLDRVDEGRQQLQAINDTLDLKVDELAEANIGLYESNRLKSEFLANVSHELRTPLNSIIGFTELLEELAKNESEADPKRRRYLGNILSSGRSLLEMINELLDMAKIEAGRMEVSIESISVVDLIEGLVRVMRPQAEAAGITLDTELGGRVPMIESDPGKLQQILFNFLSNAIKFTPENGAITISADRVTRPDQRLGVRLAVADTGPGIPEDMQDVIFEKFRQIDASHTRKHTGTGLGLAICRELAQMLGATVSFVSDPERGSTFYVDLPVAYEPDAPQPLMAGERE